MRRATALSRRGRAGRRPVSLRVLAACLAAAAIVLPAEAADAPMNADDFAAYVTGKTLFYEIGGTAYGAEHYMIGHRVVWAYLGQPCRHGHWFPASDGRICFLYEGSEDAPDCWHFYREAAGLRAQFLGTDIGKEGAGASAGLQAIEVRRSAKPLQCPGSAAGV